jgi:hypothetical protein
LGREKLEVFTKPTRRRFMNEPNDDIQIKRIEQERRIARIVDQMLNLAPHTITFVFSEDEISFEIHSDSGRILVGILINEIESMSDEDITNRLKELIARKRKVEIENLGQVGG